MKITKTQLNYLMAIQRLRGGHVSLTGISEYLKVKKPTVSVALKKLEENGYIEKQEAHEMNEYVLTPKSQEIVNSLEPEKLEFISLFSDYLGMDYDVCNKQYIELCGLFDSEFIEALTKLRKNGYKMEDKPKEMYGIKFGEYNIPFRVVQCEEWGRSMGDKGFVHPARLIINDEKSEILLESKRIYYKSKNNQILHGELSDLSYLNTNGEWIAAEKLNGKWVIPMSELLLKKDSIGRPMIGVVKIMVQATTGKMPKSTADITFNLEMIEQI